MVFERSVANPIVTALLRSPLHPLLSRRILLLSYEGRRSGQDVETPVLYRTVDDGVVVLAPKANASWWRNFVDGHPASVLLRGKCHDGVGEVTTDEAAVIEHLRWLTGPIRRVSRRLTGRSRPGNDRLRRAANGVVLVAITLEDEEMDPPRSK